MSWDYDREYAEGGRSSVPPEWGLMLRALYAIHCERLIKTKGARKLLERVMRQARRAGLLSNEYFMVNGTLIES
jgi:hypothetical protein